MMHLIHLTRSVSGAPGGHVAQGSPRVLGRSTDRQLNQYYHSCAISMV